MNSPQYLLNNYITSVTNVDNINAHLYDKFNIMTKEYPEYNMTIYYNKYDNKTKTNLEVATRSVIMNSETHDIICYTCPTPIYNMQAVQYFWMNQDKQRECHVCYEGSLISLFYYNNMWFLATRKNVYINDSDTTGIFGMFMEVLKQDGHDDLNHFTQYLNKDISYHFVLIHHNNENIVNYEAIYGKEYKKLCFIFARNKSDQAEIRSEDVENTFVSDNIFLPKVICEQDFAEFMTKIADVTISKPPEYEGIVIKLDNMILKLQTSNYMFYKAIGPDKNMFRGFINLYQSNTLKGFLSNEGNEKFKKVVNPMNTTESYDTIGMIDALFKVVTSELHSLFYILWNEKGQHMNDSLYKLLPKEYKDILFQLRGIFFQIKNKGKKDVGLKLNDVYNYIKLMDSNIFEKFIRCRKLMLNWTRVEKTNNTALFIKTLYHCDKIFYKLSAIYTTKLFPEIMPDDMPQFSKLD